MSARIHNLEELRRAASQSRFRVKQFAGLLGMTARTLERRFGEAFGCSPDEWLADQRMSEATALLQHGFSTKQVAAELAYRHAPSFFRKFRRHYGCTPTEYLADARICPENAGVAALSRSAIFLSQSATSPGLQRALTF